jgi:hypothetical protein
MAWVVKRTDTFLESIRDIRKTKEALAELDKKLKRLREDPLHVGGWLSGELHGKKSTGISRIYINFSKSFLFKPACLIISSRVPDLSPYGLEQPRLFLNQHYC